MQGVSFDLSRTTTAVAKSDCDCKRKDCCCFVMGISYTDTSPASVIKCNGEVLSSFKSSEVASDAAQLLFQSLHVGSA